MFKQSETLREQRKVEIAAGLAIIDAAEADENGKRQLTDEEADQVVAHTTKAKELEAQAAEADAKEKRQLQLRADLDAEAEKDNAIPPPSVQVPLGAAGTSRSNARIVGGEGASHFGSFGEFLQGVRSAAFSDAAHAQFETRVHAAVSGMGTTVDADGGFLVPLEFSSRILQHMHDTGKILSLPFLSLPLTGNSMEVPMIDETSRADGSRMGGVQGYWVGEAAAPTASNPTVTTATLKLHKAGCLGYITEEMLEDASAMGAFMERVFADELKFKVEDAIVRGDGNKKPKGLKNALCKIEVTKETNQTADTIWGPNIIKMWARRNPGGGDSNVWLFNQDCEPSLITATAEGRYGSAATSAEGVPLYDPPNTKNGGVGTIMGRDAIPCEYCDTVGTAGDLILFDPTQYLLAIKRGGKMRIESSIHVRFTQDERTYRAFYRIDGQPWWKSALTPYKGTNTQSPVVMLASRD